MQLVLFLIYCNKGTSLNQRCSVVELLARHSVVRTATTRVVAHLARRRVVRHVARRWLSQESINVVHEGVEARPKVEMRVVVNQAKTYLVLHFFALVLTHILH